MEQTIQEMARKLQRRDSLSQDEIIKLCFSVIAEHKDIIEQSRAAVILAGIISPGLGGKITQFLKENSNLPERVREIVSSAIMRMEGF